MLRGATSSARAMLGTAVLRMVVSSACMKNATATSHGSRLVGVGGDSRGSAATAMACARGGGHASIGAGRGPSATARTAGALFTASGRVCDGNQREPVGRDLQSESAGLELPRERGGQGSGGAQLHQLFLRRIARRAHLLVRVAH